VDATRTMIDRVEDRFCDQADSSDRDMAYGAAELLEWMVNEKSDRAPCAGVG